jgi:CspA family cold shock protein
VTSSEAVQGAIKRIDTVKGFGFIRGDDGKEYFFHRSMVRGVPFARLTEGEVVQFERDTPGDKGERARVVWID